MFRILLTTAATVGLAAVAVPASAATVNLQTTLQGQGATGSFTGQLDTDTNQLCYELSVSGLPGAKNPRIESGGGERSIQLLPFTNNESSGCVDAGRQNTTLIERNPANFTLVVDGGQAARQLVGTIVRQGVAPLGPNELSARLEGAGGQGTFSGTLDDETYQLCYQLTTGNIAGATNPRIESTAGARTVALLPLTGNESSGCVDAGRQTTTLILRNPSNYSVVVDGGNGPRQLVGTLQ